MRKGRCHRRLVGDIGHQSGRGQPFGAQTRRRRIHHCSLMPQQRHLRAALRQKTRRRQPDAAAAASDDRGSSGEFRHVQPSAR